MKPTKSKFLFLLLFLMAFRMAYGQLDVIIHKELSVSNENFTGISTNRISEQDGKIWISTEAGLHIYDGGRCRNIFYGSTPSLNSLEEIRDIVHYSSSVKYLVYDKDVPFVDRFDLKENKIDSVLVPVPEGATILDVVTKRDQSIWSVSQTKDSLFFISILADSTSFRLRKNEIGHGVKVIASVDGFWLIDSSCQIFQIVQKEKKYRKVGMGTTFAQRYFHKTRMVFQEDKFGRLWWAPFRQPKILVLSPSQTEFKEFTSFETKLNLYKLWEDHKGNLLFGFAKKYGFTSEFFLLDLNNKVENWKELVNYSSIYRQISSENFRDYLVCGTYRNTFLLKQKLFGVKSFLKDETLLSGNYGDNLIRGFSKIDANNMLIVTEAAKWYRYNVLTDELIVEKVLNKCTYTNLLNTGKVSWSVSCKNGLGRYFYLTSYAHDSGKIEHYDCGFSLGQICTDGDGIWCVGAKGDVLQAAIFSIKDKSFKAVTIAEQFVTPARFRIYSLKKYQGCYWLGTNNGLYRLSYSDQSNEIVIAKTKLSVDNLKVFEIKKYKDDLLLSTEKGVIICDFNFTKVKTFDRSNGLSNNVACASIVNNDKIWVPTFAGLNVLGLKNNTHGILLEKDGVPDNEFNTGAALKANGKLFFGTANGVVVIDSLDFLKNGEGFEFGVSSYAELSDNKGVTAYSFLGEVFDFKAKKSNVYQFKLFSSDDYFFSNATQYYYYFESDKEKVFTVSKQTLNLSSLPFGENKITVFAVSRLGFKSKNTIEIIIHVRRLFFNTWWFWGLCTLLVFLSVFQILHTLKVKRGSKEDAHKRKVAQLELSALQAQLNPHFIFNSLGAIQNYIHHHDHDKADKYIAEFAQLMRSFLESSKKKFISIADEIELLKRYTDMEQMRFDGKFDVVFNVADDIDVDNMIIPTFLLQPFLENAINHGLFHKKSQGLLSVSFKRYGNKQIRVCVEDNGIGRAAVKEIQKGTFRKHKSRAMQIIEEKSDVLRNFDNYIILINTIDLVDEHQIVTGTRVNIDIPELE